MHIEGDYDSLLDNTFTQNGKVAHISSLREFFRLFVMCENCLVRAMCLTVRAKPSRRVIITKPCKKFEARRKNPKIERRN